LAERLTETVYPLAAAAIHAKWPAVIVLLSAWQIVFKRILAKAYNLHVARAAPGADDIDVDIGNGVGQRSAFGPADMVRETM
jgi:hypothetical protein